MDKLLPADITAERATLGSILLDRDAIIPVAPWLLAEYFYVEKHAWIYATQLACYNQRIPPDLVNVGDELRRLERLDAIGGTAYLIELSNSVPTAVHVEYYGRIVERTAIHRRLIVAGGRIAAIGYSEADDLDTTLNAAETELMTVRQRRALDGFVGMLDVAEALDRLVQQADARGGGPSGVMTGFRDLDRVLGGMQGGDLLVLAARPGVGKSALALGIAMQVAERGEGVGFISLEMNRAQLGARMVALHTGLDVQRVLSGVLDDDEARYAHSDALGYLSQLPIMINDTPALSVQALRSQVRVIFTQQRLDLIIVDYLQLLEGRGQNREQEVAFVCRQLKAMAMELNVPVLALAQLNRNVERRTSQVPTLADLRESGSVEQDASIVMFIYREELSDSETDKKGIAEIHIAKHRNGPTGVVPLRFFRSTTKFASLETYRELEGY